MRKLGFIGGGNMAQAIISSLFNEKINAFQVTVADPCELCQEFFTARGIQAFSTTEPLLKDAEILIMAVKPQILLSVLKSLAPNLKSTHVVVSIAAGINIDQIRKSLSDAKNPIIRVMPNTPALVGLGMSVLVADTPIDIPIKSAITNIFEACGKAIWVNSEEEIDAVTAVSGSGPAYFFFMIESLINSGKRLGLSDKACRIMVLQTALGAAQMAKNSDVGPDILRQRVTSPGGTTEAALQVFEKEDFNGLIERALVAARDRAIYLSQDGS